MGPESFVRGGPTLTKFRYDEWEDPNTTISGPSLTRQQNASEMAFRWLADGGPTLNGSVVILRGSGPVFL